MVYIITGLLSKVKEIWFSSVPKNSVKQRNLNNTDHHIYLLTHINIKCKQGIGKRRQQIQDNLLLLHATFLLPPASPSVSIGENLYCAIVVTR